MISNKILERISRGEKALGMGMSHPSEELVELAARMGLDFVNFDGQHTPITPEVAERMCRVAEGFGITPTMRVPDDRESTILSYLDRGMRQITVPDIQSKSQAEALVRHAYFAPKGLRSSTSVRVVMNQQEGGRKQLFDEVNANTIVVPQIESVTALENLDEILTVDGIDYLSGGPEDMAQSMGLPGQHTDPRVQEAYERAGEKIRAAGKSWLNDHTEDVHAVWAVKDAAEALLAKHGRQSQFHL